MSLLLGRASDSLYGGSVDCINNSCSCHHIYFFLPCLAIHSIFNHSQLESTISNALIDVQQEFSSVGCENLVAARALRLSG
jgi:hypothetical protein